MEIIKGDIFKSNMQTIINPINCVGVMGKGLALSFKQKYPEMYIDYKTRCNNNQVKIGEPYLYKTDSVWILNFPTKKHWKEKSKIEYITTGLDYILNHYEEFGITSLAIPKIGAGLGGLDWDNEIYPEILTFSKKINIPIHIFI